MWDYFSLFHFSLLIKPIFLFVIVFDGISKSSWVIKFLSHPCRKIAVIQFNR